MTENELLELEQQLSCPSGDRGVELGERMNLTNIGMTRNSVDFLRLQEHDVVLELGHGNAGHLADILGAVLIQYYGLEISKLMSTEAKRINRETTAQFDCYDGEQIPYTDGKFDRIFSVNTIYFWNKPKKLIREISRVLRVKGTCVLTYADKEFMSSLPFVQKRFQLYDTARIEQLILGTGLQVESSRTVVDQAVSKTGDAVERKYTMVRLIKPA